jgi:hypothetical protein
VFHVAAEGQNIRDQGGGHSRPLIVVAGSVLGMELAAEVPAGGFGQGLFERERLRALVEADLTTARRLHANDFQLINPAGESLTKAQYLGSIESGQLDYEIWDAGMITVRVYENAAVIRYLDLDFEVYLDGKRVHRGPMYHTNLYERRGGRWQVVWSQASGVITP